MGEITVKGDDLEKMRRWVVLERDCWRDVPSSGQSQGRSEGLALTGSTDGPSSQIHCHRRKTGCWLGVRKGEAWSTERKKALGSSRRRESKWMRDPGNLGPA